MIQQSITNGDSPVFQAPELYRLAKRDNNKLRPWLLVNPLQGKHMPCAPSRAFSMFSALASKVFSAFEREHLLFIGFAETATAIGASLAAFDPCRSSYLPTTREEVSGGSYLYFSEVHSHATEQRLVTNHLAQLLEKADRIVFAEDEVTTGNTILQAVEAISAHCSNRTLKFAVASILNGMNREHFATFDSRDIPLFFLHTLENEGYGEQVESYSYDTALCKTPRAPLLPAASKALTCLQKISGCQNPRRGTDAPSLLSDCRSFAEKLEASLAHDSLRGKRVLVLGTEEFMFPPLWAAEFLAQNSGCTSLDFHATTRSPILPSVQEAYPIRCRFRLRSVYDPERITYIYNLTSYDRVFILHDAPDQELAAPGLSDLCQALAESGCPHISVFQWSESME